MSKVKRKLLTEEQEEDSDPTVFDLPSPDDLGKQEDSDPTLLDQPSSDSFGEALDKMWWVLHVLGLRSLCMHAELSLTYE